MSKKLMVIGTVAVAAFAVAFIAAGDLATANACDGKAKTTTTSASSCSKSASAKAAKSSSCTKSASAKTASASSCSKAATAKTASASSCSKSTAAKTASMGCCASGASAKTASMDHCNKSASAAKVASAGECNASAKTASACTKSAKTASASGCNKSASAAKIASGACCDGKDAVAGYTKTGKEKKQSHEARFAAIKEITDEVPFREPKRLVLTGSMQCGHCSYDATASCAPLLKTTEGKVYPLLGSDLVKDMRKAGAAEYKVSTRVKKVDGINFLEVTAFEAL